METEIWVWAEQEQGEVKESSLELLGEARRLAKNLQAKVCAVLMGDPAAPLAPNLGAYGADVVYVFDDLRLKTFNTDLYLQPFRQLISEHTPQIILISSTIHGASLAPRLAARFKFGFAANTVKIAVQPDKSLQITRSYCQDKANGVVTTPTKTTVVATIKPGSVGVDRPNRSHKAEIALCEFGEAPAPRISRLGAIKADPEIVALDEAERIIAAGNGLRNLDDLSLIAALSKVMGAAVGGSKPTIDKGWLPHKRLVGQSSGRRLSPRLFIGVGISGTSYFVEGMKDSRLIVAINLDKGVPLMKMADLAVVGDLYAVLPELTQQIQAYRERTA